MNIARTFVSPLRQRPGNPIEITRHRQPEDAAAMIEHLRGLRFREGVGNVGFDAYSTIVVDCDNQGPVKLWTDLPAPQPGDPDHYGSFLKRVCTVWEDRFADLA